jgi:hypothetical protein
MIDPATLLSIADGIPRLKGEDISRPGHSHQPILSKTSVAG